MRSIATVFILTILVSCSSETETRTTSGPLEEVETSYMEEVHAKALVASPHGPTKETVDWKAAEAHPRGTLDLFPEAQAEKLASIEIPVLATQNRDLLTAPIVTHKTDWYAITSRQVDTTFYIRGSRLVLETELEVYGKPEPIILSRSHGIVTASFRKFGVSYNMDIECTAPESNPLCADDDVVRALVDELVVYGGQR